MHWFMICTYEKIKDCSIVKCGYVLFHAVIFDTTIKEYRWTKNAAMI